MASEWAPPRRGTIQDLGGSQLKDQIELGVRSAFVNGGELPKESAYLNEGCLRWLDASTQPEWYQSVEEKTFLSENAQFLMEGVRQGAVIMDMGGADGNKTAKLLDFLEARKILCHYICIDVSHEALAECVHRLPLRNYKFVSVSGGWGTMEDAKKHAAKVLTHQLVLLFLGSTLSLSQRLSVGVVRPFRTLLKPDDMLIAGQDCNNDMAKMQAPFSVDQFETFIQRGFGNCDAVLGVSGPWTDRWELREEWDAVDSVHFYVATAKHAIDSQDGLIVRGTQVKYFCSRRYSNAYVFETFTRSGLSTTQMQIGDSGSYMFLGRPYPELASFPPELRLATEHDVSRMVDISIPAFRRSEIFEYIRPHHEQHHEDTRQSLKSFYQTELQRTDCLAVVAEFDSQVVGFITWHLPDRSPQIGRFSLLDIQIDDPGLKQDEDPQRSKIFKDTYSAMVAQHFEHRWICDKFAVHPDYQHRGLGKQLLTWSLKCSELDGVGQAVISSKVGNPFYKQHGFGRLETMYVPAAGDAKGFDQEALVR